MANLEQLACDKCGKEDFQICKIVGMKKDMNETQIYCADCGRLAMVLQMHMMGVAAEEEL